MFCKFATNLFSSGARNLIPNPDFSDIHLGGSQFLVKKIPTDQGVETIHFAGIRGSL